jgi:hypothetical protein
MSPGYELARFVLEFIFALKGAGNVEWQKRQLAEIAVLKRQRAIQDAKLEHELNMLRVRFDAEITREREKEASDTRDYLQFLATIDEMKQKMLKTFSDMPPPMVHIIHHHAKQLIDRMWKANDEVSKRLCEAKFAGFLMAVFEDSRQALITAGGEKLPTKTLKLISPDIVS